MRKGAQLEDERRRAAQQARLELDLHAGSTSLRPWGRRPRVLSERRLEGRAERLLVLDVIPKLSLHGLHHLVDGQRGGLIFGLPERSKEAGARRCTARGRWAKGAPAARWSAARRWMEGGCTDRQEDADAR